MPTSARPPCPICKNPMTFALPPGGKGQRSWQCLDCERPDPLASEAVRGWIKGLTEPPDSV
jgi:hypothetical protein